MVTDVSEGHSESTGALCPEDGSSMFIETKVPTYRIALSYPGRPQYDFTAVSAGNIGESDVMRN